MKYAVIVGDNLFPNSPGNTLVGCVPDAQHVQAFLLDKFAGQFYSLLPLINATKNQEMAALMAMCQAAKPGDYLFYSHSSHGGLQDDGTPFIACSDITELGDGWDPATIITHSEIHDLIVGLPAGVILEFLLDACYSSDMEMALAHSYRCSKFITHSQGGPTRPKALLSQPPNGGLWAACGPNETASDAGITGGVWTTEWLKAWKAGISRQDQMAAAVQLVKQEAEQTPELQCSNALAAKPFPLF